LSSNPECPRFQPNFRPKFFVSQDFHVNVRTLPFDDELERSTPDSQLTWSWIYENIQGSYDALNPVMARNGINFPLDNQARAEALAAKIRRVIDKANFESSTHTCQ
jgi:hypothetical protein